MIKALIVDDNLEYTKTILNNIINKFEEVQISYIATTASEAINIISNNCIDLIFLDLKLPDKSGINIINEITFLNSIKKPYIIIISGDKQLINEIRLKNNVYDIISKLEDNNAIYNKINRAIHEIAYYTNELKIKEIVISELTNIGYNWKHKGTYYILEAIIYIYYCNNIDLLDNLERNVYKYISYKNNKTINNIKTNIIKATNALNTDGISENPTPKQVISNILIKICSRY